MQKSPKSPQVTVWWADWTVFGSPPLIKYLIPAITRITSKAIKPMGTEEQTILENKYSIYGIPAGPGPIDLRIISL